MPKTTKKTYDPKKHKEFLKRCYVSDNPNLPNSKYYGTISRTYPDVIHESRKTKNGNIYTHWKDSTFDLSPISRNQVLENCNAYKTSYVYYHDKSALTKKKTTKQG